MKQKLVLLDLEETLIDSWDSFVPVNVERVRAWLKQEQANGPVVFGLFSFAVWNQRDLNKFSNDHQEFLEELFNFQFDDSLLWTLEDVKSMVEDTRRFKFKDDMDFFDFHGNKTTTLVGLVTNHPFFKDTDVVLLDDTVSHGATFNDPKQNATLRFANPKDLA